MFLLLLFFIQRTHTRLETKKNKNKKDNKVVRRENEETTRTHKLRVDRTNNY